MNYSIHRFTEIVAQSMTNSPNLIYVRKLLDFSSNRVRKRLKWKLKTGRWSSETKLLIKFEDTNLFKHVQSMTISHYEPSKKFYTSVSLIHCKTSYTSYNLVTRRALPKPCQFKYVVIYLRKCSLWDYYNNWMIFKRSFTLTETNRYAWLRQLKVKQVILVRIKTINND